MGVLASLRDWLHRRRETMECRAAVELMTDYLEGALSSRMRGRFEAHLATCPACKAYLDQMQSTIRVLGQLTPERIDADVREELLSIYRDARRSARDL
jgi:anti-sigma factor RsiW